MKHLGDITKISGYDVPAVDIVTGGSPCQDLSVAGKREGLAGERSGLFMEQIRVIKEMREHDRANRRTNEHIRPRYMVWENVPGAFSSNKGEDFRCVLEETAKVADSNATIPRLKEDRNGKQKWSKAGAILGDGWSIAWRVHDAQFWGVPQRRKRIALVADFGGTTAPEILFERKGLSGNIEESRKEGQGTTTDAERSVNQTSDTLNAFDNGESRTPTVVVDMGGGKSQCGVTENVTPTLATTHGGEPVVLENHPNDSRVKIREDGMVQTLSSRMGTGGGNVPMVMGSSSWDGGQVSPTLTANNANGAQRMPDKDNFNAVLSIATKQISQNIGKDVGMTLCGNDYKEPQCVAYGLDRASFNQGANAKYNFSIEEEKIGAQVARGPGAVCSPTKIVRRLTPLECERLQGYPDGWTDIGEWIDSKGKKHKGESDSPRYKALGNSIALPFWQWMAKRMVKHINHEATMGSLFDGIGGFPVVFSRVGCQPVWASEIEEFPIAVTKLRFKESDKE